MNDDDSSFSQKDLDLLVNEYNVENTNFNIHVEEYRIVDSSDVRFVAEFEYQNVQYQLMGIFEKAEFDKMWKIYFYLKIA